MMDAVMRLRSYLDGDPRSIMSKARVEEIIKEIEKLKGDIMLARWKGWDDAIDACAAVCRQQVRREAGYGGRWEGYGPFYDLMNGAECAEHIAKMRGRPV